MNAFQNISLALAALTMPLNSTMAQTAPTPPAQPESKATPDDSDRWIFIPRIDEAQETTPQSDTIIAALIETPVSIGGQCVLTTSYTVFSTIEDAQDREAHQRLINEWAQANEARLVEFASTLSTASFRVIGQRHSANDICHNNPQIRATLTEAFTASVALFTQGIHSAFPNVIRDGTAIGFNISGYQDNEPTVPVGNIAVNFSTQPQARVL